MDIELPPHRLYEVDASGAPVWTLEFTDPSFAPIYRAERISRLIVDTPGHSDGDWDLDLADAEALKGCFTGPGPAQLVFPCTLSDLDSDADCEDQHDFTRGWTGAGKSPRLAQCPSPPQVSLSSLNN